MDSQRYINNQDYRDGYDEGLEDGKHKDDDFDCHNFCVSYNFDHFKEKQNNSSDNKEDDAYVYLYKGTFSQVKYGNSVILSTDITYWDRNTHDDKVLKAGEIHTLKKYFPETGACLITVNNEILNKDRCKKCPNDGKCRLCLTGIHWDLLKEKGENDER